MLEKTLESPLDCKEVRPVHSKEDHSWVFFGRNNAKAETPVLWSPHMKCWLTGKLWSLEGLEAGEGDDRGWDGWMASLTRWTGVCVSSGSWWWTGSPAVLQCMGFRKVTHDWTELNWTEAPDKEFISKIYKQLLNLNSRKNTRPHDKIGQRSKQTFLQRWHTGG